MKKVKSQCWRQAEKRKEILHTEEQNIEDTQN